MRHEEEVVGVFVYTPDVMGSGAVNAIENMGYKPSNYAMTGVCMGPEGLDLIKKGKYSAIVGQPCLSQGRFAVQYLYDHIKGKPTPNLVRLPCIWPCRGCQRRAFPPDGNMLSITPTLQKYVEQSKVMESPLPGGKPKPDPLGLDSLHVQTNQLP